MGLEGMTMQEHTLCIDGSIVVLDGERYTVMWEDLLTLESLSTIQGFTLAAEDDPSVTLEVETIMNTKTKEWVTLEAKMYPRQDGQARWQDVQEWGKRLDNFYFASIVCASWLSNASTVAMGKFANDASLLVS